MKKIIIITTVLLISFIGFSQEDDEDSEDTGSVIQNLTPSKLIEKGQVDIKWFNNLFTQTRQLDEDEDVQTVPRGNFFTSTLDVFVGINKRISIGGILELRSNTTGGRGAFDVFSFDGESGTARSGFTRLGASVKVVPFKNVANFSIQSTISASLTGDESDAQGVFLAQNTWTFQNRFFYDYSFGGGDWQIFADLNTELNFGEPSNFGTNPDGSFASDSVRLTPGLFLSYFPSSKFTVSINAQHFQLIAIDDDAFEQSLTSVGAGAKYQLTKNLNIEALWSYFVTGTEAFTGLGEAYNIGLRALF